MSTTHDFSVSLTLLENYSFNVDFGDFGHFISDEPSPIGNDLGPDPVRLLAASVGNCLAASLLFAIRKFNGDAGKITAQVTGEITRVAGRLRVTQLQVVLNLPNNINDMPHLEHVLEQFESFCTVTQSVREGINVQTVITDQHGTQIYPNV